MSERARNRLSLALAIAAALTLVASALFFYADRALLSPDGFADRAESSLASEPVRTRIAESATRAIVNADPDAVAVQPLIESVISGAIGTAPLRAAFRASVRELHRAAIEGDKNSVVFILSDVGDVLAGALSKAAPQTADRIPDALDVRLLATDDARERTLLDIARAADAMRVARWLLLALALGLGAAAVAASPSRRLGAGRVAWSLAAFALLAAFGLLVARHLFAGQFEAIAADAARAVWDEFFDAAFVWLLLLSLIGVVLAAAAASALKPVDLDGSLARAWSFASRPRESTAGRAVHGAAWVVAGLAIVTNRALFVDLLALAVGAGVVYAGAAELMRLSLSTEEQQLPATPRQVARSAASGAARLIRLGLICALLIGAGLGIAALVSGSGGELPFTKPAACNGTAELCDKTLDEVAFAGTHNSMSAASYPGWLFAQQERGLGTQLDDGIRALLIDTHYGLENSRGVITDLERGDASREKLEQAVGPEASKAAERLRDRIRGGGSGKPGVYLCHGFCEVGAIKASKALGEVREFLDRNPDEVVLISVEDATSAADTAEVFEKAGLRDYIYEGPDGPPWPTLGELVRSGKRLVVMAEGNGGEPAWLRDQFAIVKETPFKFGTVEALTERRACDANRGEESNSLFLINHWVDTSPAPRPSNARRANSAAALQRRIDQCRKARGATPGILAVDFYREGDVVDTVARFNEAAPPGG